MRAAGLHAIGKLLTSEAVLIKSATPKHPHLTELINLITARIAGVIASRKYVLCQYNVTRGLLSRCTSITPGRRAATISPLDDHDWVAVSSMVEASRAAVVMDELNSVGAKDILILKLDNCRVEM